MNKLDYISRQLSRASHKKYEYYVVSRIWHILNDISIKFVTQQYVVRPEGRALTDMYFPQLKVHIEVDEPFHKKQVLSDNLREADIINATGHEIYRVDVSKGIDVVNDEINKIVSILKDKKSKTIDFKDWDLDAEYNPLTYIEKGYISLTDDCAFKTMVEAVACFGRQYNKNGIWKGGVKHPKEEKTSIWFPKLYKNGLWDNSISIDENTIFEKNEDINLNDKHLHNVLNSLDYKRIVFARVKSPLDDIMYRFKGEFTLNKDLSLQNNVLTWIKTSDIVKTYKIED